jgi:CRISPR-associated protein Csd1
MLSAVRNISRPECFTDYNHKRLLAVTCAMIKKFYNKEDNPMGLNTEKTDRSYLFGRLLAIADVLEERTYDEGEKRQTNAVRYWSAFSVKPAKTWEIIMNRLRPYMDKCENLDYYNRLFGKVHSKFENGGYSDEKLSPEYVLGYWCQRNDMYTKKEKDVKKEEEN